jgi:hypothetical protein
MDIVFVARAEIPVCRPTTGAVLAADHTQVGVIDVNSGVQHGDGHTMASPHAAGTAALCIATGTGENGTGKCTGGPADVIADLRADAARRPSSDGFLGDPNSPINNRYYGYLVYAGGY